MLAAIYARFSSDVQNERSISDQVALCTRYAEDRGWTVAGIYTDAAISGSAMANRPGLLNAIDAAESGQFDILLAEDEDRIARDLEQQAHVFNRILDAGGRLWTVATGKVELMHVAMKGFMAEDFIRNLSAKTKRGMHSNAEKGLATGSRLYGYRSAPGGAMEIIEEEAAIVRRIFAAYVAGETPREIAASLNADGIPAARGGLWASSSINGSRQRGNGILNTELYAGVKVWNRFDMKKDRRTGKRISRAIPPDQWKRTPVPELRIVGEDDWNKARSRKVAAGAARPHTLKRYPHLFSGLLKCGCCGASYTVYTTGKIVCAAAREKGPAACTNGRTPALAAVEAKVLEGLRDELTSKDAVAAYVRTFHREAAAIRAARLGARAPLEKRLAEVERGLSRLVDAIVRGAASEAMEARIPDLEAERTEIRTQLAAIESAPVAMHPRSADLYIAHIERLRECLASAGKGDTEAERRLRDVTRGLIDRIVLTPKTQARGGPINIDIVGKLAEIINGATEPSENIRLGKLVAGGGIVHTQPSVHVIARVTL